MSSKELVIDACCTLNLLATKRGVEIVTALGMHLFDTPQVRGEPMFAWDPPNDEGERTRQSVTTDALRDAGLLTTLTLDTDALIDALVDAASRIKETDASCIALAGVLAIPLISDDRKERRIAIELFPSIELVSTLDLLHEASRRLSWNERELSEVAFDLRWGGSFAPPKQDPRTEWYAALLRTQR